MASKLDRSDRLLKLSGFPAAALRQTIPLENMRFSPTGTGKPPVIIDAHTQSQFFHALYSDPMSLKLGGSYAVGSAPSELMAQSLVVHLARKYQEAAFASAAFPKLQWIDIGIVDWELLKSEITAEIVVISGASTKSDARKTELVRDIYNKMDDCTRIVIALTDNILQFCTETLGIEPQGVFQFGRQPARTYT